MLQWSEFGETSRPRDELLQGHFEGEITAGDSHHLVFEADSKGKEATLRIAGFILLALMPTEGVEEAVLELQDIFRYHEENLQLLPPERPAEHLVTGVASQETERPEMAIE